MSSPTEDIIREISGMNGDMRENVRSFELSADDISFNFGAVRRFDGKGFVVCFGKDAETVDKKITPENMLVGYQVAMDGTVIITDGSRVVLGKYNIYVLIPKKILLFTVRDITEQKNKEIEYQQKIIDSAREAEQANAAKTEFLRRMSHDIRTLINGIMGMLDIADHFPEDIEKQTECRQKVRDASGFLFDLVNQRCYCGFAAAPLVITFVILLPHLQKVRFLRHFPQRNYPHWKALLLR